MVAFATVGAAAEAAAVVMTTLPAVGGGGWGRRSARGHEMVPAIIGSWNMCAALLLLLADVQPTWPKIHLYCAPNTKATHNTGTSPERGWWRGLGSNFGAPTMESSRITSSEIHLHVTRPLHLTAIYA